MEVWLPVVGGRGFYEVSNLGNVRSVDRVVELSNGRSRFAKGVPLKPQIAGNGYLIVQISRRTRYVHDLVAAAFIGVKPDGWCVRHGSGGILDNSLTNLCYGTNSQNEYDKVESGNHHQARKTHCPRGHAYNSENTRIYRRSSGTAFRMCRQCERERSVRRSSLDK